MTMETLFECLKCGMESLIESMPPQCPACKSGNGVVRSQESKPRPVAPELRPAGTDK